jgi:hypothetical protein
MISKVAIALLREGQLLRDRRLSGSVVDNIARTGDDHPAQL